MHLREAFAKSRKNGRALAPLWTAVSSHEALSPLVAPTDGCGGLRRRGAGAGGDRAEEIRRHAVAAGHHGIRHAAPRADDDGVFVRPVFGAGQRGEVAQEVGKRIAERAKAAGRTFLAERLDALDTADLKVVTAAVPALERLLGSVE